MNDIVKLLENNKIQEKHTFKDETSNSAFDISFTDSISTYSDLDKKLKELPSISDIFISPQEFKVRTAKKNSNGTETNPPFPKSENSNDVPQSNTPTMPPNVLGWVDAKTIIGNMNLNLHHTCDFTINLKLQVCNVTIFSFTENIKATVAAKLEEFLKAKIPFLGHIIDFIKMLKEWFDYIMYYVNKIIQFIQCMAELIQAISNFVKQLMNLPNTILGQIRGCMDSLRNLLFNSVSNMINNGIAGKILNDVNSMKTAATNAGNQFKSSINTIKSSVASIQQTTNLDNVTNSYSKSMDGIGKSAEAFTKPNIDLSIVNKFNNLGNMDSVKQAFTLP